MSTHFAAYPPTECRPESNLWTVNLGPYWKVTTDHGSVENDRPVLVNVQTGLAYDQGDLVNVAPNFDQSGRQVVERLLRSCQSNLSMDELLLVGQFLP